MWLNNQLPITVPIDYRMQPPVRVAALQRASVAYARTLPQPCGPGWRLLLTTYAVNNTIKQLCAVIVAPRLDYNCF